MGAIVLPDNYGHLADSLGNIAGAVAHFVNPNHDFQLAMRDAMAKNPKLYQQLVDIEHTSPGTMEAMGFGKDLAAIARRGQSSVESQIESQVANSEEMRKGLTPEQIQTRISQAATGQTPGQAATDELRATQASGAQRLISPTLPNGEKNPDYNPDIAEEANYRFSTGMSHMEAYQSILQAKAMKSAVGTDLSGRDMGKDVKAYTDSLMYHTPGLDNNILNAYENTPGMREAWKQSLAIEAQKRMIDYGLTKEGMVRAKADDKENEKTANKLVLDSHGAFDKPTALKYISGDDATIRRIGELSAGTGEPMKPGEEALFRAAKYEEAGQNASFGTARRDIANEINKSMDEVAKKQGEAKVPAVAQLNDAIGRMAALNNDKHPVTLKWDDGKVKYFQDGKEVKQSAWYSGIAKMFSGQQTKSVDVGKVNTMYTTLKSAPKGTDIKGTIESWRKTNPDEVAALEEKYPEFKSP